MDIHLYMEVILNNEVKYKVYRIFAIRMLLNVS